MAHLNVIAGIVNNDDYIDMSLIGSISLMYFAFLRASEKEQLSFKNLHFKDNSVFIHINYPKTDVTGNGCDVEICKTKYIFDPYAIFQEIINKFSPADETKLWPMTIDSLRIFFEGALVKVGVENSSDYSLHSCRRGGATAAAAAGVQDCQIKAHGRWLSDIYQIYTLIEPRQAGLTISSVILF